MALEELQLEVMRFLSDRLSATEADLVHALGRPEAEVKQAVAELEKKQLLQRAVDSISGRDLISPTSRGLLGFRQRSSMAS